MAIKSGNPALNNETFVSQTRQGGPVQGEVMTLDGTVVKTGFLALLVFAAAAFSWSHAADQPLASILLATGVIGGLIVAMITIFNKPLAPFTSPIYAILEGLALGGISSVAEAQYQNIVIEAVMLTMATLFTMLFLYCLRIVKPTENFKLGVTSATGAIAVIYLADLIGMWTHYWRMPLINDFGPLGILVSLIITCVAALNLVIDFDFIEQGTQMNAPKYMEWYGAFGLMVTLIWLYLEILRLLMKVRRK